MHRCVNAMIPSPATLHIQHPKQQPQVEEQEEEEKPALGLVGTKSGGMGMGPAVLVSCGGWHTCVVTEAGEVRLRCACWEGRGRCVSRWMSVSVCVYSFLPLPLLQIADTQSQHTLHSSSPAAGGSTGGWASGARSRTWPWSRCRGWRYVCMLYMYILCVEGDCVLSTFLRDSRPSPHRIHTITLPKRQREHVTQASAGGTHTMVLTRTGHLYAYGRGKWKAV